MALTEEQLNKKIKADNVEEPSIFDKVPPAFSSGHIAQAKGMADIGTGALQGVVGALQTFAHAGKALSTQGMGGLTTEMEEALDTKAQEEGIKIPEEKPPETLAWYERPAGDVIIEGLDKTHKALQPQSLLGKGTSAGVQSFGVALPAIVSGAGALGVGSLVGGTFGLSEYSQFMDELEDGIRNTGAFSEEQIQQIKDDNHYKVAISALTEGGLEALSTYMFGKVFKMFKGDLPRVTNVIKKPIQDFLFKVGKVYGGELPTELMQTYTNVAMRDATGFIVTPTMKDALIETAKITAVAVPVTSSGFHYASNLRQESNRKAYQNDLEKQVDEVARQRAKKDRYYRSWVTRAAKMTAKLDQMSDTKSPEYLKLEKKRNSALQVAERRFERIKKLEISEEWRALQDVHDYIDKEQQMIVDMYHRLPKNMKEQLVQKIVDTSGNMKAKLLKLGGEEAVMYFELHKGATPFARTVISKWSKQIYDDLGDADIDLLNIYIQSKRQANLLKQDPDRKSPLHIKNWESVIDKVENQSDPYMVDIKKRADTFFKAMSTSLEMLYEEGLLTEREYKGSKSKSPYAPIDYINDIIETVMFEGITIKEKAKTVSITGSGLEQLKKGDEKVIRMDSRVLLNQVMLRTINRISRNQMNKALMKWAKDNPTNPYVKMVQDVYQHPKGLPSSMEKIASFKLVHGTELDNIQSIAENGLLRGSFLGGQSMEYSIWVVLEDGTKVRPIKHNPGDYKNSGKSKVKAIIVDHDAYMYTRDSKIVEKELAEHLEGLEILGIRPEDAYEVDSKARRLADELDLSQDKEKAGLEHFTKESVEDRLSEIGDKTGIPIYSVKKGGPEGTDLRYDTIYSKKDVEPKLERKRKHHVRVAVTGVEGKGDVKYIDVHSDIAKEWVTDDPESLRHMRKWLNLASWGTGAKMVKFFATGANPGFAVYNTFIDAAFQWMTTNEYSVALPVAFAQRASDMVTVMKDAITRKGRFDDFMEEGGGMNWLAVEAMGRPQQDEMKELGALKQALAWINETSEIANRLALRERAIKNGKTPHQATWISRAYLDFSQGGSGVRAADSVIPYLNASIQATRGIVRYAKKDAGKFSLKMAQIMGLSGTLAWYMAVKMKDLWKQISGEEKNRFFIIPAGGLTYEDETGKTRYLYVKIRKDPFQRIAASFAEELVIMAFTQDTPDWDRLWKASKDILNIGPSTSMPPLMKSLLGYISNYDYWRGRDIYSRHSLGDIEAWMERYPDTHPALKSFTESLHKKGLDVSPERLGYAIEQFTTSNNAFVWLFGEGLEKMTEGMPEDEKKKTIEQLLAELPVSRRLFSVTRPEYIIREKSQERRRSVMTERVQIVEKLKELSDRSIDEGPNSTVRYLKEFSKFLQTFELEPEDTKKYVLQYRDFMKDGHIEKPWLRRFARAMRQIPADERAEQLFDMYITMAPEDAELLVESLGALRILPTTSKSAKYKFWKHYNERKEHWVRNRATDDVEEAIEPILMKELGVLKR